MSDERSSYKPGIVPLTEGLNFTTNKLLNEPGSLQACLNRELIDGVGYKRIDGVNRYDGKHGLEATSYKVLVGQCATINNFTDGAVMYLQQDKNLDANAIFGTVLHRGTQADNTEYIIYTPLDGAFEPYAGATVGFGGTTFTVTSVVDSVPLAVAPLYPTTLVPAMSTYLTDIRDMITAPYYPPIGVHWFRDRLYAVVNDVTIYFDQSAGTAEILPNHLLDITIGLSTCYARVLDIQLTSGTWAAGTASGLMQIRWQASGGNPGGFDSETIVEGDVVHNTAAGVASGTELTIREFEVGDPIPRFASLWQSLNEHQALDEESSALATGWDNSGYSAFIRRYVIHHGWEANFDAGLADSEELVVVNRGVTNNFAYDADDVDIDSVYYMNGSAINGSAYAQYSKGVAASGRVLDGDAGWKTAASNTIYAGGAALATTLQTDDTTYAYANIHYGAEARFAASGIPDGAMAVYDKIIPGPEANLAGKANPSGGWITGTTVLDGVSAVEGHYFTGQARAPIILRDLSIAADTMPEGSVVVGIEVTVKYDTRHYAEGTFVADRNGTAGVDQVTNTIAWTKNAFSWESCLVDITSDTQSTMKGEARRAKISIEETAGDYDSVITATDTYTDTFTMFSKPASGAGFVDAVMGGATDTYASGGLTRRDLLDGNLGVAVYAQMSALDNLYPLNPPMDTYTRGGSTSFSESVFGSLRLYIDTIKVTIHYALPASRYYVTSDGSNICSVDLIYAVKEDGTFSAGTASGRVQFTNLVANVLGTKNTVEDNDVLYLSQTDADAQQNPILTFASDMSYNGLPSREQLIANDSRYQFVSANFYANEEWDGFYGVSGAGRAFSFARFDADGLGDDEIYVKRIVTNISDIDGDKPRHIANHHGQLALGYSSGVVKLAVPGNPELFDGELGASEIGVGDRITGLLSMKLDSLGVFCENSIWVIEERDGAFDHRAISPYSGAIEYTVVDMEEPVFCDQAGISTLSQSEKYGNFQMGRLSYPVSPWLLPRCIGAKNIYSRSIMGHIACAWPVRSKSQYRLAFTDGNVLVMTRGVDGSARFTMSKYFLGQTGDDIQDMLDNDSGCFVVPVAVSSQVDDQGRERIHFVHYSPYSDVRESEAKYVYEMDSGWGFDGKIIPEYYTLNWWFADPFVNTVLRKVRMDGLTLGYGNHEVATAGDYSETFTSEAARQDISIPAEPRATMSRDYVPASNMATAEQRGRSIAVKVQNKFMDNQDENTPTPPDIHQIMMFQYTTGQKDT